MAVHRSISGKAVYVTYRKVSLVRTPKSIWCPGNLNDKSTITVLPSGFWRFVSGLSGNYGENLLHENAKKACLGMNNCILSFPAAVENFVDIATNNGLQEVQLYWASGCILRSCKTGVLRLIRLTAGHKRTFSSTFLWYVDSENGSKLPCYQIMENKH
jgi:hypothetical protein